MVFKVLLYLSCMISYSYSQLLLNDMSKIENMVLRLVYFHSIYYCLGCYHAAWKDLLRYSRIVSTFILLPILYRHEVERAHRDCNKSESHEFFDNLEIYRDKRSTSTLTFYKTAKELELQMSKILDELVGPNYNKRLIPNYGRKPVEVELNLSINGMVNNM